MLLDFVEVRLQRDRTIEGQVIGFGAGFFRELAEIGLGIEDAEKSTADMTPTGIVDGPDVDVVFLGALDSGVEIGVQGIETSAEVIDTGGNHDDGGAVIARGRGPALNPVLQRKIRTRESAQAADGNAQGFSSQCAVLGEVLGDHGGAVARISYGDLRSFWLRIDEGF